MTQKQRPTNVAAGVIYRTTAAARNDNAINVPDIDIETDTELFLIIFS